MSRFTRLAPMLLALWGTACATGDESTGLSTFGGPGGGASAGDESGSTGELEDESGDAPMPMTSSGGSADGTTGGEGGDDDGNPLCCEVGAQAGCESATTEACVCTTQPSCCQAVWSQECVDLAISCEDPFCADDSEGTGTTGGGAELECDIDFSFVPPNPAPGVPFTARFTDPDGLTFVGMTAEGPAGAVMGQHTGHTGTGPFTWSFDYDGLEAGVWTFSFTHHQQANDPDIIEGTCDKQF